jgi:hypothetical protein
LAEFYFEVEHRESSRIRHVYALGIHVEAVTTGWSLSKDVVCLEQSKDKFSSILDDGSARGISEYFRDEE